MPANFKIENRKTKGKEEICQKKVLIRLQIIRKKEANQIYKEGYSGGNWLSDLFNKYKLKIAFLEDNEEINSFLF